MGGDEVSDIFSSLLLRVPLHFSKFTQKLAMSQWKKLHNTLSLLGTDIESRNQNIGKLCVNSLTYGYY